MTELAASMGLHESTVSRVVAGTSVDTPRGTLWLRSLFSVRIGTGSLSAAAVRAKLADLIAGEDRRKPLSDDRLATLLSGTGTPIARRTVAKYREMLGIPPAHRRRPPR